MTLALLIVAIWLVGTATLVGLCQSAARGDRAITAAARRRRFARESHERPLAA